MNSHSTEHDLHQEVQLLLPWYINKTLSPDQHQLVDQHIKQCLVCRREWLDLQKLADTLIESSAMETASAASFTQLRHQLNSKNSAKVVPINTFKRHIPFSALAGFGLAASLLLVLLNPAILGLTHPAEQTLYSTLSASPTEIHEGKRLKIVFEQNLSSESIERLLESIHAKKVDQPNSLGAITVHLNESSDLSIEQTLAMLRTHKGVLLVEPVQQP